LSTITSQSALGAKLLSNAFGSAPTRPSSVDLPKEPITIETTDASKIVENDNPSKLPHDAAKVSPQNS